jgi:hypothetical protein
MDLLDLLLDHDHWATNTLLEACGGLPEAQWDRAFDVGHRTLRETFGHMVFNVPFWTAFLAGGAGEGGWGCGMTGGTPPHWSRGCDPICENARERPLTSEPQGLQLRPTCAERVMDTLGLSTKV